jgi:hypothetical protein
MKHTTSVPQRNFKTTYLCSIPDFRRFLVEGYGVLQWPRRLSDTAALDYESHIKTWLKTSDRWVDGIRSRHDPYDKSGRLDPSDSYDTRKVREESDTKELLDWIAEIPMACDRTLRRLFEKYRISPIHVLDILAAWKTHFVIYRREIEASQYLRSEKLRNQHSKALLKAAEILQLWKPLSSYVFPLLSYPDPTDLKVIAKTLIAVGGAQSHRPEEVELKGCARALSALFKREASLQLPEYVGELLFAAFRWRGSAGEIKAAVKKLLKDRRSNAKGELKPCSAGKFIQVFQEEAD